MKSVKLTCFDHSPILLCHFTIAGGLCVKGVCCVIICLSNCAYFISAVVLEHLSINNELRWLTRSGILKLWIAPPNGVAESNFGVAKQIGLTYQM